MSVVSSVHSSDDIDMLPDALFTDEPGDAGRICGMYGLHVSVNLSVINIDCNNKEGNTKTR